LTYNMQLTVTQNIVSVIDRAGRGIFDRQNSIVHRSFLHSLCGLTKGIIANGMHLRIALLKVAKRSPIAVGSLGALISHSYKGCIIPHILMINQRVGLEAYGVVNNVLKQ